MPERSGQETISRELERTCADEPIHIIGTVQPHGFLLVVEIASARVVQFSSGAARHWAGLGRPGLLLGAELGEVVLALEGSPLALLQGLPVSDPVCLPLHPTCSAGERIAQQVATPYREFECVGHRVGEHAVLEWQPAAAPGYAMPGDSQPMIQVAAAMARLRTGKSLDDFFRDCVREVAGLCGFDRVMLYRFLPDWSGEVVAEVAGDGLKARFLGLRFPATDIPSQARLLYTDSRIRVLADVDSDPDTLLPALLPGGHHLDQGQSLLRGFSEVHRSYLRNMGVRATLSLSIVCDGQLWGLVACHHYSPRSPPHHVRNTLRQVCELVAGVCAMRIESLAQLAAVSEEAALDRLLVGLHRTVLQDADVAGVLAQALPELLAAFQASALCVRIGDLAYIGGRTDSPAGDAVLLRDLAALFGSAPAPASTLVRSDLLAPGRTGIGSLPTTAGLLGAQLSNGALDFCVFTRPEVVCEVHWAGAPTKAVVPAADGRVRLEPRRSFELWREDICGTARAWSSAQIEACQRLVGILSDACHRHENQRLEGELRWRAHHDHLTGLINRRSIEESLDHLLGASRYDTAVMLIDLDHFKMINDTHGHAAGDRLLRELSLRLGSVIRPADLLSRVGGDEFLLLAGMSQPDHAVAMAIADRLHKVMEEPFLLEGHELRLGLSVGIAIPPGHGINATDLMRRADLALFKAKSSGRAVSVIFDERLEDGLIGAYELERDLREAIVRDELSLVLQPEVDLASGRVVAFEALARWTSPERGAVPPAEFIPIAERSDLIIRIGRWVVRTVVAMQADWRRRGLVVLPVAVNVSMAEIAKGDLVDYIGRILKEFEMPPSCISVELTESVIMKDLPLAIKVLSGLRDLGVRTALDDFGTGYSSLSYLRQLPIDCLKVDQSFTAELGDDANSRSLTHAIIRMAGALKMSTIAEGVETRGQLQWLREHNCGIGQGYLFSRPVPAEELHAVVARIEAMPLAEWH